MSEFSVTIREAIPTDAQSLLELSKKVSQETSFLMIDHQGMALSVAQLEQEISSIYESEEHVLLVALDKNELIGAASIRANSEPQMNHIGEVGIFIAKAYWNLGLGTLLLEDLIDWSRQMKVLFRLELTVQERNLAAIHLYHKVGFQTEGIVARGVRSVDGELLDTRLMSYLVN